MKVKLAAAVVGQVARDEVARDKVAGEAKTVAAKAWLQ